MILDSKALNLEEITGNHEAENSFSRCKEPNAGDI